MLSRFLLLALLLAPMWAGAQTTLTPSLINCDTNIPCANGGPTNTGNGDDLPIAGSKINANITAADAQINALTSLTAKQPIANGGTGANTLAGAGIPVQSGSITTGDCVEWLTATTITDAGAPCGTGGTSSLPWSAITNGTNTSGVLYIGTGASLLTSGSGTIAATSLTTILPTGSGGTGANTLAGANIPVSTGTLTNGDCVQWSTSGSTLKLADAGAACGSGGGGSPSFSAITNGTNTSATMTIGSGAQLIASGTGTITATNLGLLTGLPNIANDSCLANFSGSASAPAATNCVQIPSATVGGGVLGFTSATTLGVSNSLESGAPVVGGGSSGLPTTITGTGVLTVVSDVETVNAFLAPSYGGNGASTQPGANSNTALGYNNLGTHLTTGTNDAALGASALSQDTTGANNTAMGTNAATWLTSANSSTAVGASALQGTPGAPTTGGGNTAVGSNALLNCQGACGNNTAVGASAATTVTTGTGNTVFGYDCQPSAATVLDEFDVCVGNNLLLERTTGGGTPATSLKTIEGNLAAVGHLISSQAVLTASALSGCGTTPAISANATDTKGTITEGATSTGCVLTFATAFASAPDCQVTSPSGAAFTGYSTSTTALTITNASASGNKYTYMCMQ